MSQRKITVELTVAEGIQDDELGTLIAAYVTEAINRGGQVEDKGEWEDTPHRNYHIMAKVQKVRESKPQTLTRDELFDIHEKVHGFRDNNSNTGWCSGSHVPRGRWAEVKDFQDAWERSPKFAHQAKGVEAVLRRECDTREKLMRYRKYWRVKGINPRGLDYNMLLLAMSNAIAREHNERHYLFADVNNPWSI
jgi:hypothetical protein